MKSSVFIFSTLALILSQSGRAADYKLVVSSPESASVVVPSSPAPTSGFFDDVLARGYAFSYDKNMRSNQYTIFNAAVADQVGETHASFAASADPRFGALTRLESGWGFHFSDSRTRMRIGDATSYPGTWGQAVRFGGIQIGTLQGTRADIIASPLLGSAGLAVLPSTGDVLGDNLRDAATRRASFTGVMPQANKPGNVSLALSDALGRTSIVSQPLFQSIALMPHGQSDYSFEAGRVREDFARRSDDYGSWMVSGTYRYGLGKAATVDAHAATIENEVSVVGVGVAEKVGSLGLLSANMATSRTPESSGWLARAGYEVNVNQINFALRSRLQSASYQDLRANVGVEPLRERTLASAGLSVPHVGNVSVAGVTQRFNGSEREDLVAVGHSVPVGFGGSLSTAATYAPGPVSNSSVLLSFSYPFATRKQKTVNISNAINNVLDQNLMAVIEASRPLRYGEPLMR